jgi:hypothetical protein
MYHRGELHAWMQTAVSGFHHLIRTGASVIIQSALRGFFARKLLKQMKALRAQEWASRRKNVLFMLGASVLIQSALRGFFARKLLKQMKALRAQEWAGLSAGDLRCVLEERKNLAAFVMFNPFPSYREVTSGMDDFLAGNRLDTETCKSVLDWKSEYGTENHCLCKSIYDDFSNPVSRLSTARLAGERINDRGGFQAMQGNFYTMINFIEFPHFAKCVFKRKLELNWDGIGEWRV